MNNVISIADRTPQPITNTISGASIYNTLKFVDPLHPELGTQTRFSLGNHNGRCLFLIWWSVNEWPEDTEREAALAALTAIPTAPSLTTAFTLTGFKLVLKWAGSLVTWAKSLDKAVRFLLKYKPPVWQLRVQRYLPDGTTDFTERDASIVAPVTDWAGVYVAELDITPGYLYAIEASLRGKSDVIVNEKNLHIIPLITN